MVPFALILTGARLRFLNDRVTTSPGLRLHVGVIKLGLLKKENTQRWGQSFRGKEWAGMEDTPSSAIVGTDTRQTEGHATGRGEVDLVWHLQVRAGLVTCRS